MGVPKETEHRNKLNGKICRVAMCERGAFIKGYCTKHHNRAVRHGDPLGGRRMHGMTGTKEWYSWISMKQRCYNSNDRGYKNYGGRGIRVCERWTDERMGFLNFLSDLGKCPEGLMLERINNDGDYEPGNCKWATRTEQNRNKRNSILHGMAIPNKARQMYADGVPRNVISELLEISESVVGAIVNNVIWLE